MDRLHAQSLKHFSGLAASTTLAQSGHLLVSFHCVCSGLVASPVSTGNAHMHTLQSPTRMACLHVCYSCWGLQELLFTEQMEWAISLLLSSSARCKDTKSCLAPSAAVHRTPHVGGDGWVWQVCLPQTLLQKIFFFFCVCRNAWRTHFKNKILRDMYALQLLP